MVQEPKLREISLNKLTLWEEANVRKSEPNDEIDDLANNIKKNGLRVPLLVKGPIPNGEYLVFSGQRRMKACALAGLEKALCFVYPNISLKEARVLSLSENLYRLKMTYNDISNAALKLLEQYGSRVAVAKALGVHENTIKKYIGYEAVPEEIKKLVGERKISATQAMEIYTKFPDQSKAIRIARELSRIKKREEKSKYYVAAKYSDSEASINKIKNTAAKMKKFENITINLPPIQSNLIKKLAAKHMKEPNEFIVELLEKAVEALNKGLIQL